MKKPKNQAAKKLLMGIFVRSAGLITFDFHMFLSHRERLLIGCVHVIRGKFCGHKKISVLFSAVASARPDANPKQEKQRWHKLCRKLVAVAYLPHSVTCPCDLQTCLPS